MVVELFSIRDLAADLPLHEYLGLHHISYNLFFLLSQHLHLGIFHPSALVRLSLGIPAIRRDTLHNFLCQRTKQMFLIRTLNHSEPP